MAIEVSYKSHEALSLTADSNFELGDLCPLHVTTLACSQSLVFVSWTLEQRSSAAKMLWY